MYAKLRQTKYFTIRFKLHFKTYKNSNQPPTSYSGLCCLVKSRTSDMKCSFFLTSRVAVRVEFDFFDCALISEMNDSWFQVCYPKPSLSQTHQTHSRILTNKFIGEYVVSLTLSSLEYSE